MNQGLREINFATLSTSTSGKEFRYSTDTSGGVSRRTSAGMSTVGGGGSVSMSSPSRRRVSRNDFAGLGAQKSGGSPGSAGSKTPPPTDKSKYKKVTTSVHKKQTIAHSFVTEINELVEQIRGTRSHFVQCIKCAFEDRPNVYEAALVAQQLRYCSCMKTIEAVRNDLSLSMPYRSFVDEYSCLLYMVRRCAMTAAILDALKVLRCRRKHKHSLKVAVLGLVEIIPTIGAILGQIEHNPSFIKADQHCYDGFQFLASSLKFSVEYLEFLESLKRSTINIIATRVSELIDFSDRMCSALESQIVS
jgi:hypothetical protein